MNNSIVLILSKNVFFLLFVFLCASVSLWLVLFWSIP